MNKLIGPGPLYTFLRYCNSSLLPKEILDCGAGGKSPSLAVFNEYGYKTLGIEYSEKQILKSDEFCRRNNIDLNISKGDMRNIDFNAASVSFAYFYNSIFHLTKKDIECSISEIERVLRKDGLCYVNFLSIDDCGFGEGEEISDGEFKQGEGGGIVIHTYHKDREPDSLFKNFDIIRKEKRIIEEIENGELCRFVYLDYIAKKK